MWSAFWQHENEGGVRQDAGAEDIAKKTALQQARVEKFPAGGWPLRDQDPDTAGTGGGMFGRYGCATTGYATFKK